MRSRTENPASTDGREKKPLYVARRAACEKHLEGRKPALAMSHALDFLNREVAARPTPSQGVGEVRRR
jgi:hypothetical protein